MSTIELESTGATARPTVQPPVAVVSRPAAAAAAIWIAVVGVIAYMFMPLIVGALAEDFGYSNAQLGYIAAAEAGGMAVANAIAAFWIRSLNWRTLVLLCCCTMVAANLLSVASEDFMPMVLARTVDGLAGGMLIAAGVACMSDHRNADKIFGYFIAAEMSFSSVGFLVLPTLQMRGGSSAVFLALAAICAVGLIALAYLPERGLPRAAGEAIRPRAMALGGTVALGGSLLFFMSQGGLWAFVERIGAAAGISPHDVGIALAVSSICGIAGALLANWLTSRVGLFASLVIVLAGELACMVMLHGHPAFLPYALAVCLFVFFWSLGLPVILVQCNALDDSGRLVVLLYAVGKLAYMLGPAIMGLVIAGSGDFTAVLVSSAVVCTTGLLVLSLLSRGTWSACLPLRSGGR